MPVLFVDPGSGLIQYFAAVSGQLAGGGLFYCPRPTVRSKLQRLGHTALTCQDKTLPKVEEADIAHVLRSSSEASLMAVPAARQLAARALAELGCLLQSGRVDAIFLWNGSGVYATAAALLAGRWNIATIFGENGYLPGTLQIDPQGVNQRASICGDVAREYATTVPGASERRAFLQAKQDYVSGRCVQYSAPDRRIHASLVAKFHERSANLLAGRSKLRWRRPKNRGIPQRLGALPERFVLLPMQVVKDSQLLCHSPLVANDLPLLVRRVREALRTVAPECRLVVKLHPAERVADYARLARELDDVLFVARQDVRELLAAAEAVITVNSTVGFEALLYEKNVLMVGENFYRVEGVVHALDSLDELPSQLHAALTQQPDLERLENFLANVYAHYFVKASWKDYSAQSLQNVAQRIEEILRNHQGRCSDVPCHAKR